MIKREEIMEELEKAIAHYDRMSNRGRQSDDYFAGVTDGLNKVYRYLNNDTDSLTE